MYVTQTMNLQLFAQAAETEEEVQVNHAEAEGQDQRKAQLHRSFFRHFQGLQQQGEELKVVFPGFDLNRELHNPMFSRLTSPAVGLSVEDAFFALHHRQLLAAAMEAAAAEAVAKTTGTIASGARRPRENGLSGQAAAVSHFDYRNATKEQREELKRRIRQAAAEGKKLYPRG